MLLQTIFRPQNIRCNIIEKLSVGRGFESHSVNFKSILCFPEISDKLRSIPGNLKHFQMKCCNWKTVSQDAVGSSPNPITNGKIALKLKIGAIASTIRRNFSPYNVPLHTCMGNFCREISQVWVMDTQLVWLQWVAELRIAVEGACDRDCNSKLCSSTEWRSISDLNSHLQDFTWLKFAIAVCMVLYVILSLVLEPFFRILPFKKIFLCMN